LPPTNRLRQPGQTQECRLIYVVGIGRIVDQSAGCTQHHCSVSVEQDFEGAMVVGIDESPQKLAVGLELGFIGHFVEEVPQGLNGSPGHTG
jgi:hypothetical protein